MTGGVLDLRGEGARPISGGSEVARLTSWSSRRDFLGSMAGSFSFELSWPTIGDATRPYATTYHSVELVATARVD